MCATRVSHLVILDLLILIIFGDVYKLLLSLSCNFPLPPTNPSLYGPDTPNALYSNGVAPLLR